MLVKYIFKSKTALDLSSWTENKIRGMGMRESDNRRPYYIRVARHKLIQINNLT